MVSPPTPLAQVQPTHPVQATPLEVHRGIKLDCITFNPGADITTAYDDNLYASEAKLQQRDILLTYGPGFKLSTSPISTVSINAGYDFRWNDYLDDNARDYFSEAANFTLDWQHVGLRGLAVSIYDNYNQTGNTGSLSEEFTPFTRIQGNDAGSVITYKADHSSVIANYDYGIVDYFGRKNAASDYISQNGNLAYLYHYSDHLTPYMTARFQGTRYILDNSGDFDTYKIEAGLRMNVGHLRLDVGGGNHRAVNLHPYDSNDGPAVHLALNYQYHERINVFLNASREFTTGVLTGASTDLLFSTGMTVDVLPRIHAAVGAQWLQSDRTTEIQRTIGYIGTIQYTATKSFSDFFNFTRDERTSTIGGDITIHRAEIGFRLHF